MNISYKEFLKLTNELFDNQDPLSLGGPKGEYSQEVAMLITKKNDIHTEENLRDGLYNIFHDQFDDELAKEACNNLKFIQSLFEHFNKYTIDR